MANQQEPTAPANKVPEHGDHDRVTMLSLHADGTPAQVAPELIGNQEAVLDATKEQFRQQAVSAADVAARGAAEAERVAVSDTQDPQVAKLEKAHQAAEKGAETAAERTVKSLHQGDEGGAQTVANPGGASDAKK